MALNNLQRVDMPLNKETKPNQVLIQIFPSPRLIAQSKTPTASLQRGKTHPTEYPGYNTKQSDDEVPEILEFWGTRNTPSLPSLTGQLWP